MLSMFNFSRISTNFVFSMLITLSVIATIIAAPPEESLFDSAKYSSAKANNDSNQSANLQNTPFYKQKRGQTQNYGNSPLPGFENRLKQLDSLTKPAARKKDFNLTSSSESKQVSVKNANSNVVCPPPPTPINFGIPVSDSLSTTDCVSNNFYYDSYSFTGIAGQAIVITMESTAFDTQLQLFGPNQQFILADEDGGGGTNSRILYTPTVNGTFFILAISSFPNQTGAYTLNLSQAPGNVTVQRPPFDFDGDRKTDLSIFRPAVGEWWYLRSSDGRNRTFQFGNSSDKIVPADYTGDRKTDVAVFRPSTNEWFILRSEDNSFFSFPFGTNGDIPAPADYDADGKADAAVFRPSNNTWFIQRSSGGTTIEQFGIAGDVPVTADYDGDGKSDIAIYRPSQGQWWLSRSSLGVIVYQFGVSTDKPVQGDYTGDNKTDVAFFRPSTNEWFILRSEDNSFFSFPFGTAGDVPSPGDYDGDEKFDAAIFRPSNSTWFAQRSTSGTLIQSFGIAGDRSIPNVFVP